MNTSHILFEYDKYVKKYKTLYGNENTIILIQLGSFYEMCYNDELNIGEPNIKYICEELLQIVPGEKTYKDNTTNIQKKYLMGGFPMIAEEKYLTYLLNNNYTIVIVDQITEPPNPDRKVTKILSPGTDILYNKRTTNFLLSIYIEGYKHNNKNLIQVGITAIDLATGKNYLHYIQNNNHDNQHCLDEISRFINFYNPIELIFQTKNYKLTNDDILSYWDINHNCFRINHYDDIKYEKIQFQVKEFKKVFKFSTMLNPISELHLDRKNECKMSFLYMILYVRDHKSDLLNNIQLPQEQLDIHNLTLTSNSIRQLNIVNNYSYFKGRNESLLSICNICVTQILSFLSN